MASPLSFTDVFGSRHTEPSVTGIIQVQTEEPPRGDLVNDLIILSPFRSGTPNKIVRFRTATALANVYDPDRHGDQGVALARVSKAGFGDQDVFGAADLLACRVGEDALQSTSMVRNTGSTIDLFRIRTADYGSHTRRSFRMIEAGSVVGKKITIHDDVRTFEGDNLGIVLSVEYLGDGAAALLNIYQESGTITYTGQPADADKRTINGIILEFDSGGGVTGTNVPVAIGATQDDTFTNLAAAINANVPGVQATVNTTANTVTLYAPEDGVIYVETLDTGNITTFAATGPAASLRTTLTTPTDGSIDLNIPLTAPGFKSIAQLAAYINNQTGYSAAVSPYANKFLASSSLDIVAAVDILGAPVNLTAYVEAMVDWINQRTRGAYIVEDTDKFARAEPLVDTADKQFTGGISPAVTITDWESALTEVASKQELGGILLLDTDDPSIFAMVNTFITEQRSAGKFFRAYFGAEPGQTQEQYIQLAASLDASRIRLVVQRMGVFNSDAAGGIEYLHPVFLAASLAGGAAGNRPWINPLTNKRLRFADILEADAFDLVVRESLIDGGITVVKSEENTLRVALHVTTSQDPERRMPRIASEIDTVDLIDSDMRRAFLAYRGKWTNQSVAARSVGRMVQVLTRFVNEGAIVDGKDEFGAITKAYKLGNPPSVIEAGVLKLAFEIRVGGELNHISEVGLASYARLAAQFGTGGTAELSTSVPIS